MNRDELAALVRELCALPGPAGAEDAVRDWLLARWAPSVAEIGVEPSGNVLARVGGTGRKVTLVAHMDEVGYFVTVLREDGLIEADPLRTWPPPDGGRAHAPIGHPARILTRDGGSVLGTFATITGHVATDSAANSGWWIDVGCSSGAELADRGVHIGAPVVSAAPVRRLGNRLIGKAMDDRALLAAITALIEQPSLTPRNDLRIAATVQEEIGSVGASAFGPAAASDVWLALDIAPCGKLPGQPAHRFPVDLGDGPVLVHKDISVVYDRAVGGELWSAAKSAGRSMQEGAFRAYFSDGRELMRQNTKVALLALPCRYTHSSFETIDLGDLEALIDVLAEWV